MTRNIMSEVLVIILALSMYAEAGEEGDKMKIHKSNIPLVAAIQEHVLVSGESHSGLWLGPGVIFKPGEEPRDFHFFFSSTDQKGGDSIRQSFHFTASRLPRSAGDFSQWKKQWETAPYPKACLPRTNKAGYRFVPTFNWKFHRRSGKCLGIGHLLRHRENRLSNHLEHLAINIFCVRSNPWHIYALGVLSHRGRWQENALCRVWAAGRTAER